VCLNTLLVLRIRELLWIAVAWVPRAIYAPLRGVRGEIVRLQAPEIELNHMLRLLHPRYPVYIVPRADGKLVVGATTIESEDRNNSSECRHFCHRERQNLQFA
jgi:glycine/D-amino acid oxidase-like deaminating enzyme